MANSLSDQAALEFQVKFQVKGTPVDPAEIDAVAAALRHMLFEAHVHEMAESGNSDRIPPPLTPEEYEQTLQEIYQASETFEQILAKTENTVLIDPVDDFSPTEEMPDSSFMPSLVITLIIAAVALLIRDLWQRFVQKRKPKWGIF